MAVTFPVQLGPYAFGPMAALSVATGTFALVLGLYVLVTQRRADVSLHFFFLCLTIGAWLIPFGFLYASPDPGTALEWAKAGYLGVPFIGTACYTLAARVLGVTERRRAVTAGLWGLSVVILALIQAPELLITDVVRFPWGYTTELSPADLSVAFVLGAGLLLTIGEFTVGWLRLSEGQERRRVGWLLAGISVAALGSADYLPSLGIEVPPVGSVFALAGLGLIALAVVRYRLVDLTPGYAAETILATIADPVIVCDREGRIEIVNRAFQRIFGYEPQEVRGERVEALGGEWLGDLLILEHGSRSESREGTLRTRDGEPVATRVSVGEIREDGEGPEGTVLVARDVRREREAYRALKQSEERFSSVFESSPVAISLSTVEDGRLLDVNQRYEELSGYPREELVGATSHELGLWEDPDVRARMVEELRDTGRVRGLETDARTRDGELLRVEVNAEIIEVDGEPRVLGLIQDVTERHEAEKQLEHRALHDPVTDLPNRLLFRDRLEHALAGEERRDERLAVLFLDLDRFKRVNDTLGHAAGDELLQAFGRRVRDSVREQDTVARIGGDEFAVLLEGLGSEEDAHHAVERIQAALEEPFRIDGTELSGTASIGLAFSREGSTVDDLLRESDVAMYRAKERGGGNRCEIFEPGMERTATEPGDELRT